MKKKILLSITILALGACSTIPKQAYYNRGQPESLLEVASEEVTVDLAQRNGFGQLVDVVDSKNPSSASLICSNKLMCNRASEVLDQYNVPYEQMNGMGNKVILSFESIVAHDCQNRFISNHTNPYNLNHPTFGCSVAVNQVQMVSDKNQYVDPLLTGPYDGQKAAQNYDSYLSRDSADIETESTSSVGGR